MGSVWLAEHAMLGRRAAIKMLLPEFAARPDIVARFFNEAKAATDREVLCSREDRFARFVRSQGLDRYLIHDLR